MLLKKKLTVPFHINCTNGGISAVAIATPGTIVIAEFLLLVTAAIIPAKPQKKQQNIKNMRFSS